MDGFWLPRDVREAVLTPDTPYTALSFAGGRPVSPGDEGAVTARWPVLDAAGWDRLFVALEANRARAPRGDAFWARFEAALPRAAGRLADPSDPLHALSLDALPAYTGYSQAMIGAMLGAIDLWALDQFPAAFRLAPTLDAAARWQPLGDLPGRLRFYPAGAGLRFAARLPGGAGRALFDAPALPARPLPERVVGYAAGNVPGTALLITFLALSTVLAGGPPPLVVVKNSRREPILAPLLLDALEAVDPDLVATTAVLVWDYAESAVQQRALAAADLVIAAAGDDTIAQIGDSLARAGGSRAARFHRHGHKVSFSAVSRDVLERGLVLRPEGTPLVDAVTLLAALDSIFWDQHGCLSSRVHFVEEGGDGHYTPLDYGAHLARQLGLLAPVLPRGAWPRRQLHERFDRYKLLEPGGQVRVLSAYDDDFVVVLDRRPLDALGFYTQVNECQGRVIVVRPVADLEEVPERYLRLVPPGNLQSLSVAAGRPGEGLTERFLRWAAACGARGVTAIRTVGRGAFPQLAYSWDGFIPLDLVRRRPAGHLTTIEFDAPYDALAATYRLFLQKGSAPGG